MLTRSRTGLFLSFRNARDDAHVHVAVDIPPKWAETATHVERILVNAQQKLATLERLHAKHVLPGFADRSAEEREIEALTADVTADFFRCNTMIQSLSHVFPPTQAAANVQRALAAKLQGMSGGFRKKQRIYLERLAPTTHVGDDGLLQLQDQMQQQDSTHELEQIARSIAALAELFKDLSVLVIDQGTLLDSVQFNIEQTAEHMDEAVRDLTVATRYQKNTGKRKCILLLIIIILGLIVVIILKPKRPSRS